MLQRYKHLTDREVLAGSFKMSDVEAQLYVANVKASRDCYATLDFAVAFTCGEPVFAGDVREREILLSASITVESAEEIHQLFDQCKSAGVDFKKTLKKEPWGTRTFIVRDPVGNLVLFAGPSGYSRSTYMANASAGALRAS